MTQKSDNQFRWSGIDSWDKLRSECASRPTGTIKITIEQLNDINEDIILALNQEYGIL